LSLSVMVQEKITANRYRCYQDGEVGYGFQNRLDLRLRHR
jgi:hypothetical protein